MVGGPPGHKGSGPLEIMEIKWESNKSRIGKSTGKTIERALHTRQKRGF